jgi:hypothetical protein
MLGCQRYRIAGFRISSDARRPVVQGKTAKSPDFDPLTGCPRMAHLIKQAFNRQFHIPVIQVTVLRSKYFY